MGINKGVLKCDRTESGDETYTPFYAVQPILKYIPKGAKIWCPFDVKWSAYYRLLKEQGFCVTRSSLEDGQDFFDYEPAEWDIVVSNPPFSKKDLILNRLYSFGKPFAVLLPLTTLQGQRRFPFFQKGIELLAFDKRISFYRKGDYQKCVEGVSFASAYFCHKILPKPLILEKLDKYERVFWEA